MTDHAAEQEMEMEALHAILMDDIEEYDGSHPAGWETAAEGRPSWRVAIRPTDDDGCGEDGEDEADASNELRLDLVFAHVARYPDEPPLFRLRSAKGLSDADIEDVTRAVREQVDACAGAAMVYNMVTAAQEWLAERIEQQRNGGAGGGAGREDEAAARRRAEAEEEARRLAARAHGTAVTAASFAAWRKKFDAEMAEKRAAAAGGAGAAAAGDKGAAAQQQQQDKLTGKQWFLQAAAAAKDGEVVDDGSPELAEDEEGDDYVRSEHLGGDEDEDEDEGLEDDDDFDPDEDDDDDDDDELLEFAIKRVAG
jgi:hypothetical protein